MGRLKKPPSKLVQEESSSVLGIAGELLKQEIELDAEMGRRSFREFIPLVWEQVETSDFVHDWYIDIIAEHLEAVAKFEIKQLVICIPPRHTKSLLVSVLFPSWVWVQDPKLKFVFSSYAHALALRDALRTRRLIESRWFQDRWPTVKVTKDQNRVEKYELTKGGHRFSTSVGGQLTGEGGDFAISDDPHNVKEAESDIVRKGTVNWWKEAMSSRMNNLARSSKVIIQQRVHQGDLAGEMIEEGYQHLILPMEYEPDHPQKSIYDIREIPGELLSGRFTEESVEELKKSLGDYAYAGQYQQRPAPRGGGQFKDNFKIIKKEHLPPKFDKIINGWDFAASENNTSDWTVRVKMGRVKDKVFGDLFYVLHVKRFRASGGKLRNEIKSIVESDGDEVLNDFPLDPAAAGKEWATTLRMDLMGYAMVFSPERGDKVLRSQGYASVVELGNVYLVEADWNKDFVSEHINFPAATYDDQVDAGGRAFRRHTFGRKLHIPKPANDPLRTNTIDPTKKTGYSGIEKGNAQDMVQEGKKRSKYSPRWHGGW